MMRVKACSLVPMVSAAGPEMDRGETVTLLNDLCLLAPAALIGSRVTWQSIDDDQVRATFTNVAQTVAAELTFNDERELVEFVSDDRLRAFRNGKSFTRLMVVHPRARLPYRRVSSTLHQRGRPVAPPEPEGEVTYIEFSVDATT